MSTAPVFHPAAFILHPFSVDLFNKGDQRRFALAADAEVHAVVKQVVGIQRGIKPIAADRGRWVKFAHALSDADTEAQGGVHRHRNADEAGAHHFRIIERVDGDVERVRGEAGTLEKTERPGGAERLMAQLVTRDQQHRAGGSETHGSALTARPPCTPRGSRRAGRVRWIAGESGKRYGSPGLRRASSRREPRGRSPSRSRWAQRPRPGRSDPPSGSSCSTRGRTSPRTTP